MDVGTVKELKDLENMIISWSRDYIRHVDVHGGNEYLIGDFREEIDTYIVTYIRRLYQCKYLTMEEATEFSNVIGDFLVGFINLIKEYD